MPTLFSRMWREARGIPTRLLLAAVDGGPDGAATPIRPALTRQDPLVTALRDGTPVRLRQIDARDRERFRRGFERLSPQSRYRRFFSPTPRLSESMLRRLIDTDGENRVAVGAERLRPLALRWLPADGLGVARFIRLAERPEAAEIAVTVVDRWQGRGLGAILLDALVGAATARGVRRFVAYVQPDNAPMIELLRRLDAGALGRLEDGVLVYDIELRAAPSRTARVPSPPTVVSRPTVASRLADLLGGIAGALRPGAVDRRVPRTV